jgi:hypothetical protein
VLPLKRKMITLHIHPPFQASFSIKVNSLKLRDMLFLKYGKYICEGDKQEPIELVVIDENGEYFIRTPWGTLETSSPLQEITNILYANTTFDSSVFAFHGSSIAYNKRAIVFLAKTNTGKSTLVSYLTNKGLKYITDDCVIINRTNLMVYPYTTPLHLRAGGVQILRQNHIELPKMCLMEDCSIKRYVYMPRESVADSIQLGDLFFIIRTLTDNRVDEMKMSEKIIKLMESASTKYKITSDYISFIAMLSKRPIRKIYYSDMQYVYEVITHESGEMLS